GRHLEAGGRLARPGDAPLADAGSVDDPRVVGLEAGLEVGVGEPALGNGDAATADRRAHRDLSHATGWPSRTRSPSAASMPIRKPLNAERTGSSAWRAVIVPIDWPSETISPSVVYVSGGSGRKTPTAGATITRSNTHSSSPMSIVASSCESIECLQVRRGRDTDNGDAGHRALGHTGERATRTDLDENIDSHVDQRLLALPPPHPLHQVVGQRGAPVVATRVRAGVAVGHHRRVAGREVDLLEK